MFLAVKLMRQSSMEHQLFEFVICFKYNRDCYFPFVLFDVSQNTK